MQTRNPSTRILIVEDNLAGSRRSSAALEMRGYLVEWASDEQQAQQVLARETPDLILMDFALPGIDRLARNLKTDRKLKHVTIVALTGSATNGEHVKAYEAGFDGCMIKPVDTRKLPLQVAAFLVRGTATGAGEPSRASVVVKLPAS